jgi:hypothetical protein
MLGVVLGACTNGGDGQNTPTPAPQGTEDRWLSAVDGLCGALTAAQDPVAARAAFLDRSHDALHEIATAVGGKDRSRAAGVLETMNVVEEDFRNPAGARLYTHLQALVRATVAALRVLDIESPGCA